MILRDKTMCDRKLIPEKKRNHEWQKRPLKCFNRISHFKKEKKSDASPISQSFDIILCFVFRNNPTGNCEMRQVHFFSFLYNRQFNQPGHLERLLVRKQDKPRPCSLFLRSLTSCSVTKNCHRK